MSEHEDPTPAPPPEEPAPEQPPEADDVGEIGPDLAELLEGLAQLMRDKVKFEGKVRSLAAEGKITAVILVLTPFLMALYLEMVTPGYLRIFLTHPIGRMMLFGCSALMIAGIIVLRRMVDIKV